jgi:hypothetical protein
MIGLQGIMTFFASGGLGSAIVALATGPVGWVIGAIILLGVAFATVWKKSEKFKTL